MKEKKSKSKVLAGLLGIFPPTGALGIHRFYLGYARLGILHVFLLLVGLLLTFIVIGFPILVVNVLWAIIEGIMILAGSIDQDASGRPLGK